MTPNELKELYLNELTKFDPTHNKVNNKHPEYWNFGSNQSTVLEEALNNPNIDIWVWSDQHFNHKNIINYSNRPFDNVLEMNEQMVHNNNLVVKEHDLVIWVGDVGFGNIPTINEYLNRCNGYKILVLGNHDIYRGGKLYPLVVNETHAVLPIIVDNIQMLLTHYPFNVVPDGYVGVHGHIHGHPALSEYHYNVGVEHTNYTPINIKQIVEYAKTTLNL